MKLCCNVNILPRPSGILQCYNSNWFVILCDNIFGWILSLLYFWGFSLFHSNTSHHIFYYVYSPREKVISFLYYVFIKILVFNSKITKIKLHFFLLHSFFFKWNFPKQFDSMYLRYFNLKWMKLNKK